MTKSIMETHSYLKVWSVVQENNPNSVLHNFGEDHNYNSIHPVLSLRQSDTKKAHKIKHKAYKDTKP
jgi:hypothetical protein